MLLYTVLAIKVGSGSANERRLARDINYEGYLKRLNKKIQIFIYNSIIVMIDSPSGAGPQRTVLAGKPRRRKGGGGGGGGGKFIQGPTP